MSDAPRTPAAAGRRASPADVAAAPPAAIPAEHPEQPRALRWLEWPMAVLALAVIPAILLEDRGTSPEVRAAARAVNWVVWLAFVADLAVRFALDRVRRTFLRRHVFDVAIVLVSPPFLVPQELEPTRALRALRLLRLLRIGGLASIGLRTSRRLLAERRFLFVGLVGVTTVGVGAVAVFVAEQGRNPSIQSVPDAVWWAIVTATTVGYGDVSPVTWTGRAVAAGLMLTGIGVIGVFTATVASMFLGADAEGEAGAMEARLTRIEQKLDRLLERQTAGRAERREPARDPGGERRTR